MIARRQVLATLLGAFGTACASTLRPSAAPAEPSLLDLDPLVDLVPGAGLVWLVELRPQELQASPPLAAVFAAAATGAQLDAFAHRYGGVDVRRAESGGVIGPRPVHARPGAPSCRPLARGAGLRGAGPEVEGRAVERGVTRFWGTVGEEREQVAVFGRDGVGIEHGGLGPLQAAIYFAQGRLKRSLPALRAEPLAAAAALLGPAPVRAFAPGPLRGRLGRRLRGTARRGDGGSGPPAGGRAGPGLAGVAASAGPDGRLGRRRARGSGPLRRLVSGSRRGPVRPLDGSRSPARWTRGDRRPDALALDVALDPVTMSRGVRAASGAPLAEIMAF